MAVKEDVGMLIKMNVKCFKDIKKLDEGEKIDESQILELVDFVNNRYDCADFRLISLIKTYLSYKDLLSTDTVKAIEDAMLHFKYWMDEPGSDGMCYWSENHQLLFHTCEYFVGDLFPDHSFSNDGHIGLYHKEKAKPKILDWLENRFKYGFTEWHSNTYYEEDIAPLCVLVDHAKDMEIVSKAKIILDVLFLDFAMHSFNGYFVASSGRCYEEQKKDREKADVNDILAHAFQIQKRDYDYERISALFILCKNYKVPEIIIDIAKNKDKQVIKDSMGLNLSEIKHEFKDNDINKKGMFLWSMEAFTNKESINMTMKIFNAWNLKENNFLRDLESVNIPIIRKLGLLPLVVKILNPATQGVAIERANTYTYKTDSYMLSTAQKYHPKKFGDQQHIWQATMNDKISVFSTHPGSPMFDDAARNFSPSFWVGNGINPHAIQHENKVFLIYDLSPRKGYLERNRQEYVHFYFPKDEFDEIIDKGSIILAKKKQNYIGIIASKNPKKIENSEIIYEGKYSQFIVVLGDEKTDILFDHFVKRIESSQVIFTKKKIVMKNDHLYELKMLKDFKIDGKVIDTEYSRYETPYVHAKRKPEELTIAYMNKRLYLNFNQMIREEK
ncbi:MAG: hypothetical protein CVV57_01870 [Tenericutes bacterium HGW-Tenericutes-2]|jgi:hypothetical protein|nr:MAG: hypothetical protein CVV57_01870 [Tenericutes bacterium HGW-Tenericutes-2]